MVGTQQPPGGMMGAQRFERGEVQVHHAALPVISIGKRAATIPHGLPGFVFMVMIQR
jgi:hypothetical protein